MASPVDTFKNSLFGQLKSYSNAVQGAFEQRIARPLLAFKRDLSRPTSEVRAPVDQDLVSSQRARHESSSSSSPLEIIDIDGSGSFKSIFDKVKNTLSPSVKRRLSENPSNDEANNSNPQSPITTSSDDKPRKHQLHPQKSVSFADNIENDTDSDSINQYSVDDRIEIARNARTLADQILTASIDEATIKTRSMNIANNNDDEDENFRREFNLNVQPRRIFSDNKEDLIYQDLSAEIVAYVLKHAIRTLKKEDEQFVILTNDEENEDFIDLK